jgi:hypothetical protein
MSLKCAGKTHGWRGAGKKCRRSRVKGTKFCSQHQPAPVLVVTPPPPSGPPAWFLARVAALQDLEARRPGELTRALDAACLAYPNLVPIRARARPGDDRWASMSDVEWHAVMAWDFFTLFLAREDRERLVNEFRLEIPRLTEQPAPKRDPDVKPVDPLDEKIEVNVEGEGVRTITRRELLADFEEVPDEERST